MKTIEITVYDFTELTDKAKEKARQWYREGNELFTDGTIEDAVTVAGLMGIEIEEGKRGTCIFWSGFSSQGDGACFEGTWRASGVKRGQVKEYAPKDEQLHKIAAEFERTAKAFPYAWFNVKHSGSYSHDGCTDFNVMIVDANGDNIETQEADEAEKDLIVAARLFMKWIYRQLEQEWEYQNADEQVDESIIANGYTFTIDGKRFGK